MTHDRTTAPTSIVVFGGTGDLAKRKLFPAFFNLFIDDWMPAHFQIIALGRKSYDVIGFRDYILENIKEFSRNKNFTAEQWKSFSERIVFLNFDITKEDSFQNLDKKLKEFDKDFDDRANRLFYLSVAPSFIDSVSSSLKKAGMADEVKKDRIIIEKPFGYDKASAVALNQILNKNVEEEQIYRIDHYLGKETVQNILAFRFANSVFEPIWSNKHIESVQITVAEQVGVEDRGEYYDHSGALRDMIQNHLLQILCMVAMDAPAKFESALIRDKKAEILHAVRRIKPEDINHYTVRAQYTDGEIGGRSRQGYKQEPGVDPNSKTETFVAMKFYIDNPRWQGVPFYMRTGKSMAQKKSSVVVNFKEVPNKTFVHGKDKLLQNQLTINIQPEMDIRLSFMAKKPGLDMTLDPVEMVFDYFECAPDSPEAYETLLIDALDGDATLFMRSDQVEEAWDIIATIQEEWANGTYSPIYTYAAGSWGPQAADDLLSRQGHRWLPTTIEGLNDKK